MKGLGKGLDALLGGYENPRESSVNSVSIYLIDNNNEQPRKNFNEEKLAELARSIEQHGVVQPIIVRNNGERFTIIAGERRFRAAKMAGLNEIPVIIRNMDEQEILEVALIENLQREDLNPIEEAFAIKSLMDEHDLTQEDVAKRLGKSRPAIANSVRLLNLPDRIRDLLLEGKLQAGHARALAAITDEKVMCEVAEVAAQEGWSVRETERKTAELLEDKQIPKRQNRRSMLSNDMRSAQDSLRERLGTKVSFKGNEDKGKIIIEYYSKDELLEIFDTIMLGE